MIELLSVFLQNNKPLYSFEDNSDYVYDVMWSPTHPALFACVDGVGHLDLWNLNNDTEVSRNSLLRCSASYYGVPNTSLIFLLGAHCQCGSRR